MAVGTLAGCCHIRTEQNRGPVVNCGVSEGNRTQRPDERLTACEAGLCRMKVDNLLRMRQGQQLTEDDN